MAQQVNVKFVDDLDGSDAAGTVSFAIDGRAYEIDPSEDNAARLRDSLASFVAAARKSGGAARPGAGTEDDREQVLRRFTRGRPKHPTYAALEDLGRRCAPSLSATTSPALSCAARSTAGGRWWRTGTPATR